MWREGGIEADQWRRLRPRTAEGPDGSPQAERDLKFTRQATNKIGGISEDAAKFLRKFFWRVLFIQMNAHVPARHNIAPKS